MKEPVDYLQINLLGAAEQQRRLEKVRAGMRRDSIEHALVSSNANLYYLTGRVFRGYIYINVATGSTPLYFLRAPLHLRGEGVNTIGRPADIVPLLAETTGGAAGNVALELEGLSYANATRLARVFGLEAPAADISPALRAARAVKTDAEIDMIRRSGLKQVLVYQRIPHCYQEGMSDIELQIEIERVSRLEGCLGIFRCAGGEMEIYMGNVLTGANADTPSPYDFAMGGEGMSPSLPVGANGTIIKPGAPVMVDMNGNYTGYMTDMTRCYCVGTPGEEARRANALSADICRALAAMMIPGTEAKTLYAKAEEMVRLAGMNAWFMGHRSHAGFVGHGVGIEINELPVISPRSRDILAKGNVIAIEPKFVIPGTGAVGIENTYVVGDNGGVLLTDAPEQIAQLD